MHTGDIEKIRRHTLNKYTQLLPQSRHHHGIRLIFRVLHVDFLLFITSRNDNHKRTGMLRLRLHSHFR